MKNRSKWIHSLLVIFMLLPIAKSKAEIGSIGDFLNTLFYAQGLLENEAGSPKRDVLVMIKEAAEDNDLKPEFLRALVEAESNYCKNAISPKGAIGLCQLMPATARQLGVDPFDPAENLDGGARYYVQQLKLFNDVRIALWAYNAGPNAVRFGRKVPTESKQYADKVIRLYREFLKRTK